MTADAKAEARRIASENVALWDVRTLARRAFHFRVRRAKLRAKDGGLSGLIIPISPGNPDHAKGYRYSIVYDDRGEHDADFLIGHELGHIVSKKGWAKAGTSRDLEAEQWCDDFAEHLVKLLSKKSEKLP